jgi:hypothetical protein
MVALIVNITLIIFDAIFEVHVINDLFLEYTPDFYYLYNEYIHANFLVIDLGFIILYLGEFFLSWIIAIIQRTYSKWFFYPFAHWYDLIGCIPVGSFRFVRIIRIFSIVVRLHNLGLVDVTKTYLYRKTRKYYDIIVEEVSDRVVVNVLNGVQDEINDGGPLVDDIIARVIRPREAVIVEWVAQRLSHAVQANLMDQKEDIKRYVEETVQKGIEDNKNVRTLERLPLLGNAITEISKRTISDVVYNIVERTIRDLGSDKNKFAVKETTDMILSSFEVQNRNEELNAALMEITHEVIERIKDQVKVKKWKLKELEEKGASEEEKSTIEFFLSDEDKMDQKQVPKQPI